MEMKNPPPMMTEKMPTTKPPTRSSAVSRVSSQGASALIHERSITVLHPDARDDSRQRLRGGNAQRKGEIDAADCRELRARCKRPRGAPPPNNVMNSRHFTDRYLACFRRKG